MNNTIQYKGYIGSVEFSEDDGFFYGKVMGIRSLISYKGENAKELLDDFMMPLMITWKHAKRKEKNQKLRSKAVLTSASRPIFMKKSLFMQFPIRCP